MLRYFPLEEYETRWTRVLTEMETEGFETAIACGCGSGTLDTCGDTLRPARMLAAKSVCGLLALVGTRFSPAKYYRYLLDAAPQTDWIGTEAFLSPDGVSFRFFEDIIMIGEYDNALMTHSPDC